MKARIRRAIETRLATAPDKYGRPLSGSLTGHRRLRVGDYRVIYRVVGNIGRLRAIGLCYGTYASIVRILEIAYRGNVSHYD